MNLSGTKKRILAALLVSVYVFVAFFAVHMHRHKSGLEFRAFKFQKAQDSVSDAHTPLEYADCLACHLLHDGSNLVPQEFQYTFYSIEAFQELSRQAVYIIPTRSSAVITLRGPPSVFI